MKKCGVLSDSRDEEGKEIRKERKRMRKRSRKQRKEKGNRILFAPHSHFISFILTLTYGYCPDDH